MLTRASAGNLGFEIKHEVGYSFPLLNSSRLVLTIPYGRGDTTVNHGECQKGNLCPGGKRTREHVILWTLLELLSMVKRNDVASYDVITF